MNKQVFISHSQKDKSIADLLCSSIEAQNIGCWIAPRDIVYGNDWAGEITNAIEKCSLFLFILSEHSNRSRQCPKEISIADNAGIPIICIKVDNVEMAPGLKYHLSMQQMMAVDASEIMGMLELIMKVVRTKLCIDDSVENDAEVSIGNHEAVIETVTDEKIEVIVPSDESEKDEAEEAEDAGIYSQPDETESNKKHEEADSVRCPLCSGLNKKGKRFCKHCGGLLEEVHDSVKVHMTRFCTNCGNQINVGKKFCSKCGAKVKHAD